MGRAILVIAFDATDDGVTVLQGEGGRVEHDVIHRIRSGHSVDHGEALERAIRRHALDLCLADRRARSRRAPRNFGLGTSHGDLNW